MAANSRLITCTLPDCDTAEKAMQEIRGEGISTGNISIISNDPNDNASERSDVSSEQVYNVPLNFGADTSAQMGTSYYGTGPMASLIVGTAFRSSEHEQNSKKSVYFSMPVNDDTGGTVSFILRKHHAADMKIIRY